MDLAVLERLTVELSDLIVGRRIDQVYALPRHHVVVVLDGDAATPRRLWFSANAEQPHLYLRHAGHRTLPQPPAFAMATRKLARGRRINRLALLDGDRIVELGWGGSQPGRLLFELMPRRASAYLVDGDDQVRAVWNPRGGRPSPGRPYEPPERSQRAPLEVITPAGLARIAMLHNERDRLRALISGIDGMTPLLAREALAMSATGAPLGSALTAVLQRRHDAPTSAFIYLPDDCSGLADLHTRQAASSLALAPFELLHRDSSCCLPYPSLVAAAEAFYVGLARVRSLGAARTRLGAALRAELARLKRAGGRLARNMPDDDEATRLRQRGDLLLAYQHIETVASRDAVIVPNDYEQGNSNAVGGGSGATTPTLTIAIDPALSRIKNAQRYYRRAQRSERKLRQNTERLREINKRLEHISALQTETQEVVESAAFGSLVARVRRSSDRLRRMALTAEDLFDPELPAAVTSERSTPPTIVEPTEVEPDSDSPEGERDRESPASVQTRDLPGIRSFRSSDGLEILVGRSAKGNDQLTHRVARRDDWWLHSHGPGSHVVVRNLERLDADAIPTDTLHEAAGLAAFFSRERGSTRVEVHWTQVRHVARPRGASPGLVTLSRHQTLRVAPLSPDLLPQESVDSLESVQSIEQNESAGPVGSFRKPAAVETSEDD